MNPLINKLNIKNWKCHTELNLNFKKGVNFIIGFNGIGKTSVLDAIVFSFIGRVRDKKKVALRRIGSDEDTEVVLKFEHLNRDYDIIRRFNGRSSNKLNKYSPKEELGSDEKILNFILEIFDTNQAFLENILYSPEGEIYNFLKLDQKDFINYLEYLLGIGKVNEFKNIINEFYKNFNKKKEEIKDYIKTLEKIEKSKDLGEIVDLEQELESSFQNINIIGEKITNKQEEMLKLKNELEKDYKDNYSLNKNINDLEKLYYENKKYFSDINLDVFNLQELLMKIEIIHEFNKRFLEKIERYRNDIQNLEKNRIVNKLKIEEKIKIKEIIDKLEYNYDDTPEVFCPLCRKPLEKSEFLEIHKDVYNEIDELDNNIISMEKELKHLKKEEQEIKFSKNIFDKTLDLLELISKFDKEKLWKIEEKRSNYEKKIKKIESDIKELEVEKSDYERKERMIHIKLSEIRAADKIKEALKYEQKYQNYIKGEIICEMIDNAIKKVMDNQRNFNLNDLINDIQKIWNIFFPLEYRNLLFNEKYIPYFEKKGEIIPFKNISAGEKMILLILIKTILVRKYTDLPFLIFDEPLEHLNYENRINLIDYLIDICEKGLIKQLIITTFEESLTRKFRNSDRVNVISLPSILKYKGLV